MATEPEDADLLVAFEIKNITGDYREYYKIKRNNFFSSIQQFPEHWEFFCKLDEIWKREISDLEVAPGPDRGLPMMLYINAHAKIRISMELAFSKCMQEARSVLRDAVEYVAHAHHTLRDPANLKIWLERDDPNGKKPFKKCFEDHKRDGLFKGLEQLYEKYGQLSEAGSHPTRQAFHNRLTLSGDQNSRRIQINYTGVGDSKGFAVELFSRLLLTCSVMECTMFDDFKTRLQLDDRLLRMRSDFEAFKENLRRTLITRYNIRPPAQKPKNP